MPTRAPALCSSANDQAVDRAAKAGDRFRRALQVLADKYDRIKEVRGLGLMIGVEMIKDPNAPDVALGSAMSQACAERGLLVPVVRDAELMGLAQIQRALGELMERVLAGRSLPDDLSGGTFTITNLGMFEVDAFTPIINLPEAAILGAREVATPVTFSILTTCIAFMPMLFVPGVMGKIWSVIPTVVIMVLLLGGLAALILAVAAAVTGLKRLYIYAALTLLFNIAGTFLPIHEGLTTGANQQAASSGPLD